MAHASSPRYLGLCAAALVVAATCTSAAAAASPAAASASSHMLQASTKARIPDDACAFRAYEVQVCNATVARLPSFIVKYLRIDAVFAADGEVKVDVAGLRDPRSHHSYQKMVLGEIYKVASREDESLTIGLSENEELHFAHGEMQWDLGSSEVKEGNAWCEVEEWTSSDEQWTCDNARDKTNRQRNFTCGFPCEKERAELR